MQEVIVGSRTYKSEKGNKTGKVQVNGEDLDMDVVPLGNGRYHMLIDGKSHTVEVIEEKGKNPTIKVNDTVYSPQIKDETDLMLEKLGMNIRSKKEVKELKAPMPGLVLDIIVASGDEVQEGDPLVVLEAMKMENILKSPSAAKIKSVNVENGSAIEKNTVLITFE